MGFEKLRIVGGPASRAIIQRPPDIDRPGAEYSSPSLTMRVAKGSLVQSGQVVRLPGGDHYLVGNHSSTRDWTTHHLFLADRQVVWSRYVKVIDNLTGIERVLPDPQELGTVWVLWEKVRREFTDLNLRIAQQNHLMVTGSDVREDDLIDGKKVIRVNHALGLNVVEIQG